LASAAQTALDRGAAAQFRLAGEHGDAIPIPSVFMVGDDRCDATLLGASRPAAQPPAPAAKPAPAPKPARQHDKGGPGKD